MSGVTELEKRRKIFDIISYCPGLHASKIAELLNIPLVEVEQQLLVLKEAGRVHSRSDQGYEQYYTMSAREDGREAKTQDIRKQIYLLIQKNPGLYLSRIAELLQISVTLADYHLMYMERHREIQAVKDVKGYHKRYYLYDGEVGRSEKALLDVLSRRIPLKMVLLFLRHSVMKHKDLLEHIPVAPSTLSYHLAQLLEQNIIQPCSSDGADGYELVNRDEIVRVLKKYAFHIELQLAAEGFRDLWADFYY